MNKEVALFCGNANVALAKAIAKYLKIPLSDALVSRFSDGEVRVKIKENVRGKDVFIVQPTCTPVNDNLMELLVMMDALKRASAKRITAVIPYFGYARQDRKDQPRVPISAKLVANLLVVSGASRVLTVDLHAGQIQGFFDIPLDNLYAINIFIDALRKMIRPKKTVVVSPDVGGIKMARGYAKRLGTSLAIIDKRRNSPESTEVMHILGEVKGKDAVLVDDIIATGGSLVEAATALKKEGARNIYAAITHGVLSANAIERISHSAISQLLITNSIPLAREKKISKIKVLNMAPLLAEAIKRIHFERSISILFDYAD